MIDPESVITPLQQEMLLPLKGKYNRRCVICRVVPVHAANTTQTCPDCQSDQRAGRQHDRVMPPKEVVL